MHAYYLPNGDGIYAYLVAASNQLTACQLLNTTVHQFRQYGGCRLSPDLPSGQLAIANRGTVFRRRILCPGDQWERCS